MTVGALRFTSSVPIAPPHRPVVDDDRLAEQLGEAVAVVAPWMSWGRGREGTMMRMGLLG